MKKKKIISAFTIGLLSSSLASTSQPKPEKITPPAEELERLAEPLEETNSDRLWDLIKSHSGDRPFVDYNPAKHGLTIEMFDETECHFLTEKLTTIPMAFCQLPHDPTPDDFKGTILSLYYDKNPRDDSSELYVYYIDHAKITPTEIAGGKYDDLYSVELFCRSLRHIQSSKHRFTTEIYTAPDLTFLTNGEIGTTFNQPACNPPKLLGEVKSSHPLNLPELEETWEELKTLNDRQRQRYFMPHIHPIPIKFERPDPEHSR